MNNLIKNEIKKINTIINHLEIPNELLAFLQTPSQRIRSIISLLYLKAHNKKITDNIYSILVAGEIIHNSSLLHDDVIDDAEYRRNNVTLAKKYGNHMSVILGDLLLSTAFEFILKINNQEIFANFNQCVQEMCKAEIIQYNLRGQKYQIEEYIKICEGKTAYLFMTILKNCAIISDLEQKLVENFAKNFGILYQINNDREKYSKQIDERNQIFTADKLIGIEKTNFLIDNYYNQVKKTLDYLPQNKYRDGLEDILKKYAG